MNRRFYFLIFLFTGLILFSTACSSTRKGREAARTSDKNTMSEAMLWERLETNRLDEKWMQGRARLNAQVNGDRYNVTANIMMQKDENIFMSIRKLGFEVARLIVTKDTILVLNRLERNYALYDMQGFGAFVGFPVNLQMLQEMLLGNPFINGNTEWSPSGNDGFVLQSRLNQLETSSLMNLPDFRLTNATFIDHQNKRKLESKFSNYQQVKDDKYFSYIRTYELNAEIDEPLFVELQFTDIELDKPFQANMDIPSRYSRVYY
jgi:hypothetical protein